MHGLLTREPNFLSRVTSYEICGKWNVNERVCLRASSPCNHHPTITLYSSITIPWWPWSRSTLSHPIVHSRRRDSVNKASPASPQLTARSGQSAQLLQCTHYIRMYVNLHSDIGHPCNGRRITWSLHDFILRAKELSRASVYDYSLVSANDYRYSNLRLRIWPDARLIENKEVCIRF
jgi:hypothetical protein